MTGIKNLLPHIILLEVLAFSLLFILAGYIFYHQDPLFLHTFYSPTVLLALVLSLYYGFVGSLPFLGVLALSSYFLYKELPITFLLWNLLITLIASEFRYYWSRRIKTAELERDYLQEQISRLRKELFVLKLSHDQLEFNYVTRPYSLRGMIKELRDRIFSGSSEDALIKFFLNVLSQNFQIYKASLFRYTQGSLSFLAGIGGVEKDIDTEDPLLKLSIESQESYFLPPKALKKIFSEGKSSRYLAVVHASVEGESFILAIEDIAFVNLNEEVLTYIHVLLLYILEDIVFSRKVASLYRKHPECPFEFIKELYKMYELKQRMGIHSSLVIFEFAEFTQEIIQELERSIRSLDVLCFVPDRRWVIFLLPFTAYVNAKSFVNRILSKYKDAKLIAVKEVDSPTITEVLEKSKV